MATVTGVWCREDREMVGIYPNSTDADAAIRRILGKRAPGHGGIKPSTLDKVTLTI